MHPDTPPIHRSRVVRHSFVVRIWQNEGKAGWQGQVQHVATGESVAVRDADELVAFIEKQMDEPDQAGPKGLK